MSQDSGSERGSQGRRRLSVDDSVAQLINRIHHTMGRLGSLWDQVHMEQRAREARVERAYEHFYGLLEDIINSEEAMVHGVASDIEARRIAVQEYRRELQMEPFDESVYPAGSIALLKAYDKEHARLAEKRIEHLSRQVQLYHQLTAVHLRLGKEPPMFAGVEEKIQPPGILMEMASLNDHAEKELAQRLADVAKLQAQAKLMVERLGQENVSAEELTLIQTDFHISDTAVSADIAEKLENACEKLQAEWDEWVETAKFRYDELLFKLEDLYEKCAVASEERIPLKQFSPESHGMEMLQMMQKKADGLETRYQRAQVVFDKFGEWYRLWKEKTGLEDAPVDYKNRGGDLARRLKREQELKAIVPRVLSELTDVVAQFLVEHRDVDEAEIHIGGLRPEQRAAVIMKRHEKDKEELKLAKQIQKLNEQTKFGTPAKQPLHRTRKTPSSIKKKNMQRKRSISCSEISAITPVHDTTSSAPMTSSPKTPSSCASVPRRLAFTTRTPLTPGKQRQLVAQPITPGRTPTTPRRKPWK